MALVLPGKMTKSEFVKHRKKCTVQANAHLQGKDKYKYGKPDPPFEVYRIEESGIMFPRYYAIDNVKQYVDMYKAPENINLSFSGALRPHQIKAIECIKKSYDTCGGALLCLGCGLGKTVVANYMISEMSLKTVVLVHKQFLLDQWEERIRMFLPGARIGKVQGTVQDVENKDIILVMLQTVATRDYMHLFQNCGQLIVDECHHIAAKVFCGAMFRIPVKYTLGLSATPNRKDGLEYVIHWFLGPTVLTMENISENKVDVIMKEFDLDYPDEVYNKMKKLALPVMITNLSDMKERNEKIVEIAIELLDEKERQILILSERREQLKTLQTMFDMLYPDNALTGLYIGGMKQTDLKFAESKRIMLSTYAMTSEGFDNPNLNTLIFATPKTNIEQSVGRILRKVHDINPVIIDIVDNYSLFKVQGYQRRYYYKNKQYTLFKNNRESCIKDETQEEVKLTEYAFDDE